MPESEDSDIVLREQLQKIFQDAAIESRDISGVGATDDELFNLLEDRKKKEEIKTKLSFKQGEKGHYSNFIHEKKRVVVVAYITPETMTIDKCEEMTTKLIFSGEPIHLMWPDSRSFLWVFYPNLKLWFAILLPLSVILLFGSLMVSGRISWDEAVRGLEALAKFLESIVP